MGTNIHISKLTSDVPQGSFTCGNQSIDDKILNSYELTLLQHAYAYQITIEDKIVGYYMLKLRRIDLENCPIDNEYISDYYVEPCKEFFSINLEYIAIATEYQGLGIGQTVMKNIINYVQQLRQAVPIVIFTLSSLKSKYDWYNSIGFEPFSKTCFNNDSPTIEMYLDLLLDRKHKLNKYYVI